MVRVWLVNLVLAATCVGQVSADSLRGHVSFLASDLLEGRDTPSRGLDIAAAYIAAQFRRAGLESVTGDDYYQTANWTLLRENTRRQGLRIHFANRIVQVAPSHLTIRNRAAVSIRSTAVQTVQLGRLGKLRDDQSVVVVEIPKVREMSRRERRRFGRDYSELTDRLRDLMPVLVLLLDPTDEISHDLERPVLVDPENPPRPSPPMIAISDAGLAGMFREADDETIRVTVDLGPAVEEPAPLHNVVGLLRGSDPRLAEETVIVMAHYDHVGLAPPGSEDPVNNGANDNASGTSAVIEIAASLSRLSEKPRRSILFVTFFGEERGLLGANYYVHHPVIPLEKTVAAINFEHLGRTDSSEGPQLRRATITGFKYSSVPQAFVEAGKQTGIEFYRHPEYSRAFFGRSDNIRLAEKGVPSHTIATSVLYPDYHAPGDEWDKLDYENMAAVTSAIVDGILLLANRDEPPTWSPDSDYQR